MSQHLILKAKDGYSATQILKYINQLAALWWQSQGYTIENGELIGKKNGIDNPNGARTNSWAEIKTAPDGTEYFFSLSNDLRFCDWKDHWSAAGLPDAYIETELPEEWIGETDQDE